MVTLAFAQLVYFIANQWRSLTGGENGLQGIPREFFGADLSDPFFFYYAALPLVLVGVFAAWRIVRSPFGRVLVAIRDNPARARALGYPVERYKLLAFVLSATLAGLAGGLHAVAHGFASMDDVHWTTSGKAVLMVVLGGIGTLWGSPVGAALVVQLEDVLATAGVDGIGIVTGAVFVLVVLLFRRGLWGTAAPWLSRLTGSSGFPSGFSSRISPRLWPSRRLTKAQPTEAQPTEAQPTEAQPTEAQPTEAQPTEAQPTEAQPTEAQLGATPPGATPPASSSETLVRKGT
jgi:branched-chain amino acid transport system permease protein